MKTIIQVEQLKAAAESAHLEKALESVQGVEWVAVDSTERKITVEHADVPQHQLLAALAAAGYPRVELVQ